MAIIYSYPENNNILPTDILVCTSTALINGKPKNQTKNISIADLTAFMALNGDNLNDVLTNGNTSLLSANIGQLGLFDAQAQNYGSLELSSSEFNFSNASSVVTSTLANDSLVLYPNSYTGQLLVPNTITTNRVYTFPDQSGIVALTSDIAGFVPYTGALSDVDLGIYNLTANSIIKAGGTNLQFLMADGSVSTAPSLTGFVPYTGATQTVNLGVQNLYTTGNVGIGTVTPAKKLDVNGDILVNGITIGRGGGNVSTNTVVGISAFQYNNTGFNNVIVGGYVKISAVGGGSYNTAIGYASLSQNSGSYNTSLGSSAGNTTGTSTNNETGSNSVYIGYNTKPLNDGDTNEIIIGYTAVGAGSNTATLGNTSITTTRLRGAVQGGSFVKDGGTSSQFLKADGSVDSSTYVSGSGTVGYIPKFSAASGITNSILQDSGAGTITLDANPSNLAVLALKPGSGQASLVSYFFNNTVRFQTGSDASGNYRINVYNAGGSFVNCALFVPSATTRVLINSATDDGVNDLQVNGSLIATSIKKTSGTSNQYLMADGSTTTSTSPEYKYNFSGSATLTGTLTTTNLLTITIPANSLTNYLDLRSVMVQQSGPALAGFQIRVWHNSVNDFNTATRIANFSFGSGGADLFAQLTRKFSIQSGTLFGFSSTPSNATGDGSNPNAALSIAFNPAAVNYLFVSVQLNNVTDTATLRNVNITT